MPAHITSTVPVLASLDIGQTLDFYTRHLGFTAIAKHPDYLIVQRDGAEIHFWLCADQHIAENTSCYVRVADTDALFAEFSSTGLNLAAPAVLAWGMKELYVIDPHGNLLKFGQSV
jgi:catechol 2,3-dioxygenase-like lactoylglutathione lyase family enzyme